MVVAIAMMLIYAVVHGVTKRRRNIVSPLVIIMHAVGVVYIAITAVAALTFPLDPPYADAFEANEWRFVGAYIFITGLFYFLYSVTRVFARGAGE